MEANDENFEELVKLEKELREIERGFTHTRHYLNEAVAHDVAGAEDALHYLEDFEACTNITINNIAEAVSRYAGRG